MPNYIINRLHLSGEQSRIDQLLESIKGEETVIDFNKIIPMPESLNIEAGSRTDRGLKAYKDFVTAYTMDSTVEKDLLNIPKESEDAYLKLRSDIKLDEWELGRAAFQNEQKYGSKDWYQWRVAAWGSKWESWNTNLCEDNTVEFYTAWSRVMPVIQKLAENYPDIQKLAENYPDIKFEYSWADEDLGSNVGTAEFENGQVVHDEYLDSQSKEAYELAAEMWGLDLEEEGFVFNEKLGNYEWQDVSESPQMS